MKIVEAHIHRRCNFFVAGGTAQTRFKLDNRIFDFARLLPYGTGHPVHLPQFVENGAAYAGYGIGFKFDVFFRVEFIDGVEQAELSESDQIVEFDISGHADGNLTGNVFYERHVLPYKSVAQLNRFGFSEFNPKLFFRFLLKKRHPHFPHPLSSYYTLLCFVIQSRPYGGGYVFRIA